MRLYVPWLCGHKDEKRKGYWKLRAVWVAEERVSPKLPHEPLRGSPVSLKDDAFLPSSAALSTTVRVLDPFW